MNKKGQIGVIFWIAVAFIVVIGIISFLNTFRQISQEKPNSTTSEITGETIINKSKEVVTVTKPFFAQVVDMFIHRNATSTNAGVINNRNITANDIK